MAGTFACPECGAEIEPEGTTPGRLVRCPGCSTRVEVPFLPRAATTRRFRTRPNRARRWIARAWIGLAVLALVIALIGGGRWVLARGRRSIEARLAQIVASADEAERAGRLDRALSEIEAALRLEPKGDDASAREALRRRRDDLSRREAEMRLASAATLDPARAVGEVLTLRERARTDPALAGLVDRIDARLEVERLRRAEADLADARRQFEARQADTALAACLRARASAEALERADQAGPILAETRSLVSRIAAGSGVVVEPPRARLRIGTTEAYRARVVEPLAEALRKKGYAVRPDDPEWGPLWDASAPHRFTLDISESQDGLFMASQNRVSRIEVKFELTTRGRPTWTAQFTARNHPDMLHLGVHQAGRLGTNARRNPDDERILYDDAFERLVAQFAARLRTIPEAPAAPSVP